MAYRIPFNRPFIAGANSTTSLRPSCRGHLSGDGPFGKRCADLLARHLGLPRVPPDLLVLRGARPRRRALRASPSSGRSILPSFTFTSTANSVMRFGARPVFVDIRDDTLNLDERLVPDAVTSATKAIWPVHYAGVACEMDPILAVAERHGLLVVEDAAQGIGAAYHGRPLGTLGHSPPSASTRRRT